MEVNLRNYLYDGLKRIGKDESLKVTFQNYLDDALMRVKKEKVWK